MINWKHMIYNFSFMKAAFNFFAHLGEAERAVHNRDILSAYKVLMADSLENSSLFHHTCSNIIWSRVSGHPGC